MPEQIKALIVILLLSTTVFVFARRPAFALIRKEDYSRRRNLWLAITLTAFLAHNIWIYVLITSSLVLYTRTRESNPVALFFFLLFVIPASGANIPGMGLVKYFFFLSHPRLLALIILLPAYFILAGQKDSLPFGRTLPDKLLAAYLALIIILYLRETTITDTLRQAFYQLTDVFLPYYVFSRFLKDSQGFRDVMLSFVIVVMILALIGTFETARHWLLYAPLERTLGITQSGFTAYGLRAGLVRAAASVQTIPLGYVIATSLGFHLFLQRSIRSQFSRGAGLMLLIAGLLATLSRGPWMGVIFLYLVFISTGQRPVGSIVKYGIAGLIGLTLIIILPGTDKITALLPYYGTSEEGSISYREKLIENSLIVINRNPFFGSVDYFDTPEMEAMRQGQGIIDIVNTYIKVALESGYIGVTLFIGFFLSICWGIYRRFKLLPDKNSVEYLLGRSLLATLSGILLIIFTVSSISIIPVVYWSIAGMGAAYISMMDRRHNNQYDPNERLA